MYRSVVISDMSIYYENNLFRTPLNRVLRRALVVPYVLFDMSHQLVIYSPAYEGVLGHVTYHVASARR